MLNAAILCCKAPRTACWIWRSINKIIIIIIIKRLVQNNGVFDNFKQKKNKSLQNDPRSPVHKWTQSVLIIITCIDHQSIFEVIEMAGSSAEDWLFHEASVTDFDFTKRR